MKTNLLLLSFFFFSNLLFAQQDVIYVVEQPQYIYWGDFQYQCNLRGIKYLMSDLEKTDRSLFEDMQPVYQSLLYQQNEANIILGVGSAATVGFIAVGFIEGLPDARNTSRPFPSSSLTSIDEARQSGKKMITYGLLGSLTGMVTYLTYNKKRVKQDDVFNFMNEFNRNTSGNILELGLAPKIEVGDGGALGLSLVMKF